MGKTVYKRENGRLSGLGSKPLGRANLLSSTAGMFHSRRPTAKVQFYKTGRRKLADERQNEFGEQVRQIRLDNSQWRQSVSGESHEGSLESSCRILLQLKLRSAR
jgi:hypothetical protein